MAGTTGLEPATSAVTGQRSNQLNYVPRVTSRIAGWWAVTDLNRGPSRCKRDALTAELTALKLNHPNRSCASDASASIIRSSAIIRSLGRTAEARVNQRSVIRGQWLLLCFFFTSLFGGESGECEGPGWSPVPSYRTKISPVRAYRFRGVLSDVS